MIKANPATSRVPKKPPMTQPMSMEKLVPLSKRESQCGVVNRSSLFLSVKAVLLKTRFKKVPGSLP